jgi:polysaccharide biosynthesis protein PelG
MLLSSTEKSMEIEVIQMAGIELQLEKLMNKGRFYKVVRSFVHSSMTISGPMILCIAQLLIAQKFLSASGESFERELLLSVTMYSFIFSQLITGGFLMVVSRYAADQIYLKKEENIMSSLYGAIALVLAAGGVISIIFYSFSPLGMTFKITAYLFFIELLIVNILAIYVSAVKRNMYLVKAYSFGAVTAIILMSLCLHILDPLKAEHLLMCMACGFLAAIFFLTAKIKEYFPKANKNYFAILPYIQKYPSLFAIGLFYTISLFGHIFIVWISERQVKVGGTFVTAPFYDVPVFYAFLTILPAMIMFVVSMETSLFKSYKRYYEYVNGESSLKQINEARSQLIHELTHELAYIMRFQLIVTILAVALGPTFIPLSLEQYEIFNILVIGNYFLIIMYVIMQMLLYFDDRTGVLMVISAYMSVSLISMAVIVSLGGNYGLASFLSGAIGLGTAFLRLLHYTKNLEYYTFCSQPLLGADKESLADRIARKLNVWNGSGEGEK